MVLLYTWEMCGLHSRACPSTSLLFAPGGAGMQTSKMHNCLPGLLFRVGWRVNSAGVSRPPALLTLHDLQAAAAQQRGLLVAV